MRFRITVDLYNILTSEGDICSIVASLWSWKGARMDGIVVYKTQLRSKFMSDALERNVGKLQRNVGMDPVMIYLGQLWFVNHKIQAVQKRTAAKTSSTGNVGRGGSGSGSSGSCNGAGNVGMDSIVEDFCKQVIMEILKEINENRTVIYAQFSGLGKDWELVQKTL